MIKKINVNKNIEITYIPMTKLKTTTVCVFLHRELNREDASKNAILPAILKINSKLCPGRENLAHFLDNLYGARMAASVSKRGNDQILCFEAQTISDKYAPNGEKLTATLTELLLSVVFDSLSSIDEKIFETEKQNAISKIENVINEKRSYASIRCLEEMSKDDVFSVSRIGYIEDFKKMTKEELLDYYKKIVTSSYIDIFVCGETDIAEIENKVKEYISNFDFTDAKIPKTNILKKDSPINNITEKLNVTQGKLSMGFLTDTPIDSDDIYSLILGNAIFGGGAQSKLFNNVREKLSLAYYAGSSLNKLKGILNVNAGIEFANFQKAYDEILVQLEEIKKGNISDLEIEASKNFIINSLNSLNDDQVDIISYYLGEKVAGTNTDIEEYKKQILSRTKEDVKKAMENVHLDTVYFLTGGEND